MRPDSPVPVLWLAPHRVVRNLCLPLGTRISRFPARGAASTQGVMRRTGGLRQALPAAGKAGKGESMKIFTPMRVVTFIAALFAALSLGLGVAVAASDHKPADTSVDV